MSWRLERNVCVEDLRGNEGSLETPRVVREKGRWAHQVVGVHCIKGTAQGIRADVAEADDDEPDLGEEGELLGVLEQPAVVPEHRPQDGGTHGRATIPPPPPFIQKKTVCKTHAAFRSLFNE